MTIKRNLVYNTFLIVLIMFASCKEKPVSSPISNTKGAVENEDTNILKIQKDENKDRAIWQKPETVVSLLGSLDGKTIADIGAGTGYFTFRMAIKAKKVVAIDIVDSYLDILDNLKHKLPENLQAKIETRLGKEDNPMLKDEEVDIVVIINTFSLISDKIKYLKTIETGIKDGGKIFIVDFKMKNLAIPAPKKSDRLAMFELEDMLDKAGYVNIVSDDTTLDYQYIVVAEKSNK